MQVLPSVAAAPPPPPDTIVAPATPPGRSALSVVRLSGPGSHMVRTRCLLATRSSRTPRCQHAVATFGRWVVPAPPGTHAPPEVIDEVVATFFEGPRSFTGEDMLEVSCHGSPHLVRRVVESCLAAGARMARPGEFTQRAFLNGKLDLTRAQAVVELIGSATDAARRHAIERLRGGLERAVREAESAMLDAAAMTEAWLDFPEDDVGPEDRQMIAGHLERARLLLARLLATFRRGRLELEGARVVLAGPPNVGKSSLFNAILGRERALVTPIAGTTRDVLEARVDLEGIPLTLIDTAGLRETVDEVERLGVGRSHEELEQARAVLWLMDATTMPHEAGLPPARVMEAATRAHADLLLVLNKTDAAPEPTMNAWQLALNTEPLRHLPHVVVAARQPETLAPLLATITSLLMHEATDRATAPGEHTDVVLADIEQHALMSQALEALDRARAAFAQGLSGELVMVDLQESLDKLAAITGASVSEEKLDRIFRQFCLGK